jgi:uncharacterized protein with FMN-binding domain
MKKWLMGLASIIIVVLVVGCTKVNVEEGKYKEGTYFGFDDASKSTVVIYVDTNGLIKSTFIDAAYLSKDNTGNSIAITKQILGNNYGMKGASPISKEWYEQIQSIADKVTKEQGIDWLVYKYRVEGTDGKYTFTTVMPEGKTETDKKYTDTVSGVTINVDGIFKAIGSALDKAKK